MTTVQDKHDVGSELGDENFASLTPFDFAEHLDSPEMLAAYLSEAFFDGNPALIAETLGDAARAKGMPEVAAKAGLARESLYKALRPGSQPRLETILRVLKALDLRLVVQPISDVGSDEDSNGSKV
jgi:probable addiction module antidote protein